MAAAEEMACADQQELLRLLEDHGQQFLGSFASPVVIGKRKGETSDEERQPKKRKVNDESEEEWSGFGSNDEDSISDSDEDLDGGSAEEIGEQQERNASRRPDVVVFSDQSAKTSTSASQPTKAQMKAFMSSKVTKVSQDVQEHESDEKSSDEDDERTHVQNDALLHRLVHTHILPGSSNPDLSLTPAQRKKMLAGRILEAAGKAKLGKGETTVRSAEHKMAAKRVREGIIAKQKERNQKQLEEAKNLGNYHPTLKRLYDASSQTQNRKRTREKGLRMGVGSFRGGVLKLSREDISSVQATTGDRRRRDFKRKGAKR
ncbi:uncharacterized protein LAESUDRAFT_733326 [Laetiporus sulphureus 93-53]|uniref:Uncharacterized protein n=1 Tax=Laetiporus sulphureus 93-53 TaxID=1314785 RepID=A0A165I859_9APHY|nr:uncharacterized protein LAESUDRAFT_733326 [Laetiporus sulphureus 93-53]KZT12713.1 hypothetical protein LAESUDRAFT_733326 [Laetiporus sulphureus 93-53]